MTGSESSSENSGVANLRLQKRSIRQVDMFLLLMWFVSKMLHNFWFNFFNFLIVKIIITMIIMVISNQPVKLKKPYRILQPGMSSEFYIKQKHQSVEQTQTNCSQGSADSCCFHSIVENTAAHLFATLFCFFLRLEIFRVLIRMMTQYS